MFQVRIHGRGGQGVVSGAELLSVAAFLEGRHALAVPRFDSDRVGAPVTASCRIDDRPVRMREPVTDPDALIVQDPTLLDRGDLFEGLCADGYVLVDSTRSFEELGLGEFAAGFRPERLCPVPATELARKHVGRAVPNVPLLGGFAAVSGQVKLESLMAAVREKFPHAIAERNVAAAVEAYAIVSRSREALHA